MTTVTAGGTLLETGEEVNLAFAVVVEVLADEATETTGTLGEGSKEGSTTEEGTEAVDEVEVDLGIGEVEVTRALTLKETKSKVKRKNHRNRFFPGLQNFWTDNLSRETCKGGCKTCTHPPK